MQQDDDTGGVPLVLQGEVPDSMRKFWRFLLNKNLPPNSLGATSAAVFGLGDSGAFCSEPLLESSYFWLYLEVTKQ